jgi:hypothetical protein
VNTVSSKPVERTVVEDQENTKQWRDIPSSRMCRARLQTLNAVGPFHQPKSTLISNDRTKAQKWRERLSARCDRNPGICTLCVGGLQEGKRKKRKKEREVHAANNRVESLITCSRRLQYKQTSELGSKLPDAVGSWTPCSPGGGVPVTSRASKVQYYPHMR